MGYKSINIPLIQREQVTRKYNTVVREEKRKAEKQ
jgi:hypothetical protein